MSKEQEILSTFCPFDLMSFDCLSKILLWVSYIHFSRTFPAFCARIIRVLPIISIEISLLIYPWIFQQFTYGCASADNTAIIPEISPINSSGNLMFFFSSRKTYRISTRNSIGYFFNNYLNNLSVLFKLVHRNPYRVSSEISLQIHQRLLNNSF